MIFSRYIMFLSRKNFLIGGFRLLLFVILWVGMLMLSWMDWCYLWVELWFFNFLNLIVGMMCFLFLEFINSTFLSSRLIFGRKKLLRLLYWILIFCLLRINCEDVVWDCFGVFCDSLFFGFGGILVLADNRSDVSLTFLGNLWWSLRFKVLLCLSEIMLSVKFKFLFKFDV